MRKKLKRIKTSILAITLAVITVLSTPINAYAVKLDFSGIGDGSSSGGSSVSGSYLVPHLETNPAVGYRFAVINSHGKVLSNQVIDVYHSDYVNNEGEYQYQPVAWTWSAASGGDGKTRRRSKQELLQMCKKSDGTVNWSAFGSPDASKYDHDRTVDRWTTCDKLGLNEIKRYPEQISDWITPAKLDKILALLGTNCSAILSDSACVSVEPLFEARIQGKNICGTVTDLAIILRKIDSDDIPPKPSSSENILATITRATNREFPNMLRMPDKNNIPNASKLLWTGASKIGDSAVANYSTLMLKGYGVGICYGKVVNSKITVRYHDRQETTYNSAHIIKRVDIPRGSTFNLTSVSDLGLTNGDYNFKNWVAYDNGIMSSTTSGHSWGHFWGYTKQGGDGWYTGSESSTLAEILDGSFLSSKMTTQTYSDYIDLYPVWETTPHKNIRYYKDYESYQNSSEITYTIYDPQGTHANTQLKYANGAFTQTAPLLFPNASIDGGSGHGAFTEVLSDENTKDKNRSFKGWVVYNTIQKQWGGMRSTANGLFEFQAYDKYEDAAKFPIKESVLADQWTYTTDSLEAKKYVNTYGNGREYHRFNAYFGKGGVYWRLGDFYVVGVYESLETIIRYKSAMNDADTIKSSASGDTFSGKLYNLLDFPSEYDEENRTSNPASIVYPVDTDIESTEWWNTPGIPWSPLETKTIEQKLQNINLSTFVTGEEYSISSLSECYTSDELTSFATWQQNNNKINSHFGGFEFGGWTFARVVSSYGDALYYYGYDKNNTLGWYTLDKINTNKTNSANSYFGFYVFAPDEAISEKFIDSSKLVDRSSSVYDERNVVVYNVEMLSLWKELPTYTVNYYEEDGTSLGSQVIPASEVIKAQTNGENYQFYSRYNKKLNSSPNSAYDYLGWSYDSSADASPNIGFDDVGGNNNLCYSGYENYSPWAYVSSTAFTWQTDSNGNKYLNLYAVKNLKPNITVKYNPNGDMDYIVNSGDRDGITGTMNDVTIRSDVAITNGIPLDSCAYVKESYTFDKWVVYSSQMNGYYGKRAGATSYEWITNVNEIATFKTISSTDTLFTSENAQFLKDTGVTSGDIILYATWNTKYDVYYTTQHPAGSNIVSNYDVSMASDGYPVHQECSITKSFQFFENKFEDKSGNYEYKGWSVYIVNSAGEKIYYCDDNGNKKVYQASNYFYVTNLADLFGGAANIPGSKVYVEAQWEPIERPNSIIVKYNPNSDMDYTANSGDSSGISGVMSDEIYTVGTDISIADNLYKKTGHSHNGWVLYSTQKAAYYSTSGGWTTSTNSSTYYVLPKSDGRLTFDGILNGVTDGELILYAVWKPITYTIKYNPNADVNYAWDSDTIDRTDANGVKITGEMADTVVTYGVPTELRDVSYQYPNHTFVGWVAYRTTQKQYYVYADESLKTGKWVTVDKLKDYTFGDYGGFFKYNDKASVSKTSAIDGDVIYMFAIWKSGSYTIKYNPNVDKNCVVDDYSNDYIDSSNIEIVGEMPDQIVTCGVDQEIRDIYGIEDIRYYYLYPSHRFVGWVACRENATKTAKQYYAYTGTSEDSSGWITKSNVNPIFGGYNGYKLIENQELIGRDTPSNWTITLFAVWEADACSVQFIRNTRCGLDDYVVDIPNSVQVKKGSEFVIPSGDNNNPKLSNSNELKFIGWNTKSDGSGTSYSPLQTVVLNDSVLNDNNALILYAQWRIQLDISVEEIYYSTDSNGMNKIGEDIKLKENNSYFTFLKISNNSQFFDVTFEFASNVSIAGKSLQSTSASGVGLSNGSQFDLCSGRITVTPPSENSLIDTFFTADSAIIKFTGDIRLTSVTRNGESTWTYSETNTENNSKKLEKNFLINAPSTTSSHQSSSYDIYSGQLVRGTHSYYNMSLFGAVFSFFAERRTYSNSQIQRFDENFASYGDFETLVNNVAPFSALGFNQFTESKSYRYRNVGENPISFTDAYSRMSWVNSNPEIYGENNSTLTVYPIDLIANGASIYKEGSDVVYNKGVYPGESYSVEATYLLKTKLNPANELHANIQVTIFGITEDGNREYICQAASNGVTFSEYTIDANGATVYQLKLKTDSFTVAKKYTEIYINGYIYDSALIYTAYSTFFEQSGTNNTFEIDVPVVSPFTIEFIKPNAYYTRGKEVVSGFRFINSSPYNLKNDVDYTISVYDTKEITKDTDPIAQKSGFLGVPSSNITMIWIKWTVPPEDMPDVAYIKVVADTGAVYNTTVLTAQWYVKDNLVFNTPDTAYSDNAPSWYNDSIGTENAINMSSYNLNHTNKGNDVDNFSWNYFAYNDATSSYQYITNEVSVDGTAVISKKGCPDTEDGSIKSGYGYGLNVNTFITSTAPENAVTDCQNAYVAFPEFNNAVTGKADEYYQFSSEIAADYLISASGERNGFKNVGSSLYSIANDKSNNGSYGTFATLKKSGNTFELPINSSTGDATHFIPIWMPDGDYEVTGIIDEIWTPMGMISKKIVSNTLQVSGNMYDDFKVSHYTIKQAG